MRQRVLPVEIQRPMARRERLPQRCRGVRATRLRDGEQTHAGSPCVRVAQRGIEGLGLAEAEQRLTRVLLCIAMEVPHSA